MSTSCGRTIKSTSCSLLGPPREQADVLADACRGLAIPVFTVFGKHDLTKGAAPRSGAALERAGVRVLDRDFAICESAGLQLGIVGTKGFVGGFPGSSLPDFGEPLLRQVYAGRRPRSRRSRTDLHQISHCDLRLISVLRYGVYSRHVRVGEVAERAGVNIETLRYYERRDLLPEPVRGPAGQRKYGEETVRFLRTIKEAQAVGFTLVEVSEYLRVARRSGSPSPAPRVRRAAKIDEIAARIVG